MKFASSGTTLARDSMAGVTTFIVMSYIIFVNPQILSFAGIDGLSEIGLPFNQVLAATCLVAGVMTIAMGLGSVLGQVLGPAPVIAAFGLVTAAAGLAGLLVPAVRNA